MKRLLLVLSGVADVPASALGQRTPLEAARTPHLDRLARAGRMGAVATAPAGQHSGSDLALLTLLGYDPQKFPLRRGPLEAAGAGVKLAADDLVLRGNFVSIYNETIVDLSAGRISSGEAQVLLRQLSRAIADPGIALHHVARYRFLLVFKGGRELRISTQPPHAATRRAVRNVYPGGEDAPRLARVLDAARQVLAEHDINKVRVDLGENPANFIWPWGEGADLDLPSFEQQFGCRGSAVAGAALAKGIAKKAGFKLLNVRGATGDLDTDLTAKAEAARRALAGADVLFVHVQGANEASHMRDPKAKAAFIEEIDAKLIRPLADELDKHAEWRALIASDHVTATETDEAVVAKAPFLLTGSDLSTVREVLFDERHAAEADLQIEDGPTLMEYFLRS